MEATTMSDRDIAIKLMESIMYDNGWVNRLEPEIFAPPWMKYLAPIAGRFFANHPHLLTDEVIEDITTGEGGENEEKYGHLTGFTELHDALDAYFETGGDLNIKPPKIP